ncbi:MAG: histidine kinase [Breznakibacter sp.]
MGIMHLKISKNKPVNVDVPIKKISLFNFWIAVYFCLFGFFTTLASVGLGELPKAVTNSLLGLTTMLVIAFGNLGLFVFLDSKLFKYKIGFIVLSYCFSFAAFVSIIRIHTYVNNTGDLSTSLLSLIYLFVISILTNTLILALQNFIIVQDAKVKSDIENSCLKATNAEAATQLLRQQIQPHFLFNALNILKSLYRVDPQKAEKYLLHLSNFLRASVSNNTFKVISLKEELKLCENYIEMQKIRFAEALKCSISIPKEKQERGFIPSFSIQPLLENAIKHNELTEESPLHIAIELDEDDRIRVTNNRQIKNSTEASTGSGLVNLSERYRILSGDELIIHEDEGRFSVSIKILSHENSNHRR